jgi:hypothetical protein
MLAFAIGCALLGGCATAPFDGGGRARHYEELRGEQRIHRDPIPYRDDGSYHRPLQDRTGDERAHEPWR